MTDPDEVRELLLELGLEDWIPVPDPVRTLASRGSEHPEQEVRVALVALGREGRLRFWRGPWDDEDKHVEVSAVDVESLLEDPKWFHFRLDEENEERLYFVNVENIAPTTG